MTRRYIVIKHFESDYLFRTYSELSEANAAVNPSNEFPGEYICAYDLELKKYVHIEGFPGGITPLVSSIIQEKIAEYKTIIK